MYISLSVSLTLVLFFKYMYINVYGCIYIGVVGPVDGRCAKTKWAAIVSIVVQYIN